MLPRPFKVEQGIAGTLNGSLECAAREQFLVAVHRLDSGHNGATNRTILVKQESKGGWDGIVLAWDPRGAFAVCGANSMARVGESCVFSGCHLAPYSAVIPLNFGGIPH